MKNIIVFLVILLLCLSSNCNKNPFVETVYRFSVQNNSSDNISFSYSLRYPDTMLYKEMRIITPRPGAGNRISVESFKQWGSVINEDIPGKKLLIYIFTIPVNDKNWDSVRTNYLVKKRMEITADDLKSMNNTISYP